MPSRTQWQRTGGFMINVTCELSALEARDQHWPPQSSWDSMGVPLPPAHDQFCLQAFNKKNKNKLVVQRGQSDLD